MESSTSSVVRSCWVVLSPSVCLGDSPDILSIHYTQECAKSAKTEYNNAPEKYYQPEVLKITMGKLHGVREAVFLSTTKL